MANISSTADCGNYGATHFTMTNQSNIALCQSYTVANTSFCWPPNATRICVPATDIPIFWPPYFYNSTPQVFLSTSSNREGQSVLNSGNTTFNFTPSIFDNDATAISGKPDEKTVTIWFQGGGEDKTRHEGQTFVLVKTGDWPAGSTRDDDDGKDDGGRKVRPGVIAGSVIGGVVAIVAGVFLCCWRGGCCCGAKKRKRGGVEEGDKEMGREGEPTVAGLQDGVGKPEVARSELPGAEGEKVVGGAPPKYTP